MSTLCVTCGEKHWVKKGGIVKLEKTMINIAHLDFGSIKCDECTALWRVYDKDLDGNRAMHDYPKYCMYCGKALGSF